jgi:hypothetical protein
LRGKYADARDFALYLRNGKSRQREHAAEPCNHQPPIDHRPFPAFAQPTAIEEPTS